MAHIQQQEFCRSIKNKYPNFFKNKFVLDIGSLDINGNNQEYFENCNYLGVDIAFGRNVDIVSKGHELAFPDETFDIIISTECFEHDQFYEKTIKNIYRMLKSGGLLIFTCATTGRPEHGTRRTTPEDAPLLQNDIEWSDYYKNLTEQDIRNIFNVENNFSTFEFSTNEISYDLYFYGFKKGNLFNRDDYSFLLSDKPRKLNIFTQLYINEVDNDFSEKNSIKYPVSQTTELQRFEFDLKDFENIKNLRLDPLNDSCVIEIDSILLKKQDTSVDLMPYISSNCDIKHSNSYFFTTNDSQIYFENLSIDIFENATSLEVSIRYAHISKDALEVTIKQELEQTKQELANIYTSKSWKLTRPLRKIMRVLKRNK